MSWQAVHWVLNHSRSRGAARLVAISIASHANPDPHPSVETIAREAGIRRASVFPCLDRLEALGELKRISGGGRCQYNRYELTLFAPQTSLFGTENGQRTATVTSMETVSAAAENGQRHASKRSAPQDGNHNEPEPQKKTSRAARAGDPRHRLFVDFAAETFRGKYGQPPSWCGSDYRRLSELLKHNPSLDSAELNRRWRNFVASADPFFASQKLSLRFFCGRFDSFIDGPVTQSTNGGPKNGINRAIAPEGKSYAKPPQLINEPRELEKQAIATAGR